MHPIINIWRKELMDIVRDKKAVRQSLLIPLVIGMFYAVMNPLFSSIVGERARAPLSIPAQGIENAGEDFITTLARYDITLEPFEGDLTAIITAGDESVGLIIPPGFGQAVTDEQAAQITLLTNPTSGGLFGGGFSGGERLDLAISDFNSQVAAARVQERAMNPALLTPVSVEAQNLATPAQLGGVFASFTLPLLVVLIVVQGGLFAAIDVTAGEKERGTLEALLVTPATDIQVMVGKLLAVFTLAVVPYILTLIGFWVAGRLLPESMKLGGDLPFSVIGVAILVGIPTALFMSVIQMAISVRTKTFKDAQSAAAPLSFLALLPAFAASVIQPQTLLAFLIPVYGPAALVGQMTINGGILDISALMVAIIGSLGAAVVAFVIAMRLFNRERLLYAV
jgi:sodium transport system permease protein